MRIERLLAHLRQLGLPVEQHADPHPGAFLPGVWIDRGVLGVCPWAAHPGDVLHEAGHLALVPGRFRAAIAPGDLEGAGSPFRQAGEDWLRTEEACALFRQPDHPLQRALLQMGDYEAIAWAYAAATAIGFRTKDAFVYSYPDVPLGGQPYQGNGEEVWLCLELRQHAGIHGLQHAGMCSAREYPKMIKWLQD